MASSCLPPGHIYCIHYPTQTLSVQWQDQIISCNIDPTDPNESRDATTGNVLAHLQCFNRTHQKLNSRPCRARVPKWVFSFAHLKALKFPDLSQKIKHVNRSPFYQHEWNNDLPWKYPGCFKQMWLNAVVCVGDGGWVPVVWAQTQCQPKGVRIMVSGMLDHFPYQELTGNAPSPPPRATAADTAVVIVTCAPSPPTEGESPWLSSQRCLRMLVREAKKPCCFWEIPKKEKERKHGNMCQHEFSFTERKLADTIHQCQARTCFSSFWGWMFHRALWKSVF